MRKISIIPWLSVFVLLAAARFGGSALILASVSHPYGGRILNALGVLMAGRQPCFSTGWFVRFIGMAICAAGAAAKHPRSCKSC